MIYGNQILCKSDFKMNFEQFNYKMDQIQNRLMNFYSNQYFKWFWFPYFPFRFQYQKNKQVCTGITVKLRKFTTMSIQDLNRGL